MAGPVTPVLDTFTRANESPIGAPWAGPVFTGSGLDLNTNQLAANSGTFQSSYWNTSFSADQEVYATLPILPGAGDNLDLFARIVAPGATATAYELQLKGNQQFTLIWVDTSGTGHNLGIADTTTVWAAGDKMMLRCTGTTIEGWRYNGTTWGTALLSVTDSNITTGGYIGAAIDATVARIDDFGGGGTASMNAIPVGWLSAISG